MVIMLQGAGFGGMGFFVTMGLAYLLALFYVFSFAELALMFQSPGNTQHLYRSGYRQLSGHHCGVLRIPGRSHVRPLG